MYEFTTAFAPSEMAYRTGRIKTDVASARGRTGRGRRSRGATRHER